MDGGLASLPELSPETGFVRPGESDGAAPGGEKAICEVLGEPGTLGESSDDAVGGGGTGLEVFGIEAVVVRLSSVGEGDSES